MSGKNFISGNEQLLQSQIAMPGWWKSRYEELQAAVEKLVKRGELKLLATSPGGREVNAVIYGDPEPELKGTANFNSAAAAGDLKYYYRRNERKTPVLILMAGVHGQEMESMVAMVSLISLMETGKDLEGREHPSLLDKLNRLRLIIIPVSNPDGRARVPYDSWVGLPHMEKTKYGQGTKKNGEYYMWPYCKAIHPMVGDVGILGGYYDDAGINIQHDEWTSPMSEVTRAILDLVREEGPDLVFNLHGHEYDPSILPVPYVPESVKQEIYDFSKLFYGKLTENGYSYRELDILGKGDLGGEDIPPFHLNSVLYHTGAGICITYESPHGCIDTLRPDFTPYVKSPYGHEDIHKMHMILAECITDWLLKGRKV